MSTPAQDRDLDFGHSVVRTDGRLMILSTCTRCNQDRLVSMHDGSLEAWETNHRCSEAAARRSIAGDQGQTMEQCG